MVVLARQWLSERIGRRLRLSNRLVRLFVLGLALAAISATGMRLIGGMGSAPSPSVGLDTAEEAIAVAAPTSVAVEAPVPELPTPAAVATAAPTAQLPPPVVQTYRVAPGDTLAAVAARYGLRVETLLWANSIADPDVLRPGQELRIPAVDGVVYTLQFGDTLRSLAERASVPLKDLIAANRLDDPDHIAAGAELLIPGASPALLASTAEPEAVLAAASLGSAVPLPPPAPPKPATVTYQVQPGDTLADLGTKFGIDLETLLAANELGDPNAITVGTTLRILPVSGVEHLVAPGERLSDIAARYRTVLGLIVDFNGLADPDRIRPGDRLVIPGGRRALLAGGPGAAAGVAAAVPVVPAALAPPAGVVAPIVAAPVRAVLAPALPRVAAEPDSAAPEAVDGSVGQRIAAIARRYEGSPYVWGGTSPGGFDCSGLVWYVFDEADVSISRGLWGQYNAGAHVARSDLEPGDIVFFQNTYMPGLSHNGIYLGDGQFIHAVDESQGVRISSLSDAYWARRWFGATRVSP
ncbi:MAG: LysM peptidoglycan-binding domain-containing protein [Chloroflexi bacterium]|nr:LysM peptidoglycan-binding domain-containing protein [Chloroflexota bacterium]